MNTDEINGDILSKPAFIDFALKDFTPPPSPPQIQDSITVLTAEDEMRISKWGWWQGYRKDRWVLGFEVPNGKNLVPTVKRGPRRKKGDDD